VKHVGLIGCGAIADAFHLPGLRKVIGPDWDPVLVDPDLDRARSLAEKHGVRRTASSHRDVLDDLDGAIIASPHSTHVPIALELVEAGIPVLCEKPLGTNVAEVERLRDFALERGVTVAVNQTRRFIPAAREVGRIVASGELGSPLEMEIREGDRFGWPAATPSMFGARSGGRGLLLDIGAHVLDLAVDWFGTELEVRDYRDDSFGGSEASVEVHLEGEQVSVRVRLSWLAKQRNEYVLRGPEGTARWNVYDLDTVSVEGPDGRARKRKLEAPGSFADLAPPVLEDFFSAVADGGAPAAGPDDVLPSMRLIEECYRRRTRFEMPWHPFAMEPDR
jgi:predicted dehydrogenase